MYIQPHRDSPLELPVTVPRDYSGHTFRPPPAPPHEEPPPAPAVQEPPQKPPAAGQEARAGQETAAKEQETAACDALPSDKGLLSRIPLLSSLLPPKRSGKHEGDLPEWVILGLVLVLLMEDANDVLPFLLLLLLWD